MAWRTRVHLDEKQDSSSRGRSSDKPVVRAAALLNVARAAGSAASGQLAQETASQGAARIVWCPQSLPGSVLVIPYMNGEGREYLGCLWTDHLLVNVAMEEDEHL